MRYRLGVVLISLLWVASVFTGCVARSAFEVKEKELAKSMGELEAARATGRKLGEELEALKAERNNLQRRLESANQRVAEVEQTGASQEAEAGRLRRLSEGRAQEVARLQKETAEKEQELAQLKATYNELVLDLKKEIEAGEIKVTQFKDLLTVNLVEKILFDSGKAEIKPRGLEILKRVGAILKNVKDKQIRIEGHTDNIPIGSALAAKYPSNWELSAARATVVARYFQEKVGIPPQKLAPTGFSEYRPVASNSTDTGRAQNRRIEIILAPLPPAPQTK